MKMTMTCTEEVLRECSALSSNVIGDLFLGFVGVSEPDGSWKLASFIGLTI